MGDTKLADYPARLGDKQLVMVDHTGPATYAVGGETIGTASNLSGITVQGLSSIDEIIGGGLSVSGNFITRPQPTGAGSRQTWKLLWYPTTQTAPDVPLSLGTATAASTLSAVTSKVGTVTVANTYSAGNFVALTLFTQLGALNGVIVRLATATPTAVTFNLGSAADVVSGADTTGKLQLVQAGAGNPLRTGASAAITNSIGTASLLTITSTLNPPAGSFVYLDGMVNGAAANGVLVQVLPGASATSFTANWWGTGHTFSTGAETTGTASQLITNGNALIQVGRAATVSNSVATASSAATAGLITLTAANNLIPGNIGVIQGLTNGAIDNGIIAPVIATSLTSALFKLNTQTGAYSTAADAGTFSLLTTGAPTGGGETHAGTVLSGETVRLGYIGR